MAFTYPIKSVMRPSTLAQLVVNDDLMEGVECTGPAVTKRAGHFHNFFGRERVGGTHFTDLPDADAEIAPSKTSQPAKSAPAPKVSHIDAVQVPPKLNTRQVRSKPDEPRESSQVQRWQKRDDFYRPNPNQYPRGTGSTQYATREVHPPKRDLLDPRFDIEMNDPYDDRFYAYDNQSYRRHHSYSLSQPQRRY